MKKYVCLFILFLFFGMVSFAESQWATRNILPWLNVLGQSTFKGNASFEEVAEFKNSEDLVLSGTTDGTAIYVYDATKDSDGGNWTCNEKAQASSWYNETLNDADRGATRCFPKRAVIIAENDAVRIYDAKDNSMWMVFSQGANHVLGADANNNPSSVFALNGKIYVGLNGSSALGLVAIDLQRDEVVRYNATNRAKLVGDISTRNTGGTYVSTGTVMVLVDVIVNDVHGAVVNAKTLVAAATDTGLTILHITDSAAYDYSDVTADDYNAVWISQDGHLYAVNETQAQVERWNSASSDTADELNGTPDSVWDEASVPALWTAAPTIQASAPDQLTVIEDKSIVDGTSNVILFAHAGGLSVIHEKDGDQTNGAVKYLNSSYITEAMVGDVRGMFSLDYGASAAEPSETGGAMLDRADTVNHLTFKDAGTANNTTYASGVRGVGANLSGDDYFCADANADATCDDDTGFKITGNLSIGMWIKPDDGQPAAACYILNKISWEVDGYALYLTTDGKLNFQVALASAAEIVVSDTALPNGANTEWTHLVATFTANSLKIYVNGVLEQTETATAPASIGDITAALYLASNASGTENFVGMIDDVVILAETLTAAQIKAMYEAGRRAAESGDTDNEIAGASDIVKAVGFDDDGFIVIGTNDGADGGGVSVVGLNSDTREATYLDSSPTDDSGDTFPADDIVALGGSGANPQKHIAILTDNGVWLENTYGDFADHEALAVNPHGKNLIQDQITVREKADIKSLYLDGTQVTSTAAELNVMDGATAANVLRNHVSIPIYATANATVTFGELAAQRAITIKGISVTFHTKPTSALGTVTLAVTNYDLSATADDNLLNAATYDLEGLTNKTTVDLTLTATTADLSLSDGDFIYCQIVSNNADMTGGTGGVLTVEYTID